jgi:electron transport complex protein RnfB
MLPLPEADAAWTDAMAEAARARHEFRALRLARERAENADRLARKAQEKLGQPLPDGKRAVILAAMERAKARSAGGRRTAAKK